MRSSALAVLLVLQLPAGAALAGDEPEQVTIEARLTEITRLDFDLGFELGCDHSVDFVFGTPGILAAVNTPSLTRRQSFEFQVVGFGTMNVAANFTGAGGGCVGAGSDTLAVTVKPDLAAEVRLFGRDGKGLARSGAELASQELGTLGDGLDAIVDAYVSDAFDESEAAAQLFDAAGASLAFVAAGLTGQLAGYADDGSALLDTAGALVLPRAFRTGAKGSLWEAARESASGTYSEFAIDAEALLCESLDLLESTRTSVRLQKRFEPFLVHGPRLAEDPDDVIVLPTAFLGMAAWNGPAGRGLAGMGYGVPEGGSPGSVRFIGPGGRDQTFPLAYEMSPRQDLFLLIRPKLVTSPPPAAAAVAIDNAPGNWRLELRDGADGNASDVVQITAP